MVCGIDPGLARTGYAVLATEQGQTRVVDAGVCRLNESLPLEQRLVQLDTDLEAIWDEYDPDVVAVEELYAHYQHPRTAILMGHARGVILLGAARRGFPLLSLPATRVKRHLTGNGQASKAQMQRAIQATLSLTHLPEPADVADALAIALCGLAEMEARALEAEL